MEGEENLISGIHNYCDSWCSRCEFTSRCSSYAMMQEFDLDDSDDPMGDTLEVVKDSFAEAKGLLIAKAEEMGIDLEKAMQDPEVDKSIARRHDTVYDDPAFKLAYDYMKESRQVLEKQDEWLPETDDSMADEMLQIARWFSLMIPAKIHHGLDARLDVDGYEVPEEIINSQSDANGQIKAGLIGIDRSIVAWEYLRSLQNSNVIDVHIEELRKVRFLAEDKFPNAREFIRPGFDEIEMVM